MVWASFVRGPMSLYFIAGVFSGAWGWHYKIQHHYNKAIFLQFSDYKVWIWVVATKRGVFEVHSQWSEEQIVEAAMLFAFFNLWHVCFCFRVAVLCLLGIIIQQVPSRGKAYS